MLFRSDHQATRSWVEVTAIFLAGLWALYTFVYQAKIVPSRLPANLVMSASLDEVARKGWQGRDSLVCIRVQASFANHSRVPVHILAAWFRLSGTTAVPRSTKDASDAAYVANLKQNIERVSRIPRSYDQTPGEVVSDGWFLTPGWWFEPDEQASESFLFFAPANKYDAIRFEVYAHVAKDETPFVTKWVVGTDGRLGSNVYLKLKGFEKDTLQIQPFDPWKDPVHRRLAQRYGMANTQTVTELSLWRSRREH